MRYKPTPRECTLLFLRLIEVRAQRTGKSVTRIRLAEITLKRLWNRERIGEQFLADVEEWFLTAGWALIYAGNIYAAVRIDAIENWPRVSSKLIASELIEVGSGRFEFEKLERLMQDETDAENADALEAFVKETTQEEKDT
jgi:hypothetical protein